MKENNQHSESENAPPRSFSDIHIAENQTFSTNGHQITMFLSVQQRLTSHRIAELFVAQIKCHKITSLRIFSSSTYKSKLKEHKREISNIVKSMPVLPHSWLSNKFKKHAFISLQWPNLSAILIVMGCLFGTLSA